MPDLFRSAAFLFLAFCYAAPAAGTADEQFAAGMALAREGKLDDARALFVEAAKTFPNDKRFPTELAGIEWRRKNLPEARKYLSRALALDRQDNYLNEFLATVYARQENLPAALTYWNRVGQPLIGEVRVVPPLPLKPLLGDRALAISPGQVLTPARLRQTDANLDRLGVLVSHRWLLIPRDDGRYALELRSTPAGSVAAGWIGRLLPLARGLPFQTLLADWTNIGRQAINISSLLRWDSSKRRAAVYFSSPFRMNPRVRFSAWLDARDELWDVRSTPADIGLRRYAAGASFETGISSRATWTSGVSLTRRIWQTPTPGDAFQSGWSFEWPNRLAGLLWESPEHGFRIDGEATASPGRVIASFPARFLRAEAGAEAAWSHPNLTFSTRPRAGRIFGTVPLDQFYMLGMERDNDLWLRGHSGTRGGRKGNAPLGTRFVLIQNDVSRTIFRFPFLRVTAGPFYDTASVSGPVSVWNSRGWVHDAGVQLKLSTFGGLAWTFIYGRNLRDGGGAFFAAASRTFPVRLP